MTVAERRDKGEGRELETPPHNDLRRPYNVPAVRYKEAIMIERSQAKGRTHANGARDPSVGVGPKRGEGKGG